MFNRTFVAALETGLKSTACLSSRPTVDGMAKNSLRPETLSKYLSGVRRCPKCEFDLPVSAELVHDHWYVTRRGDLSPYCKTCTKFVVTQSRRDKRQGRRPKRTHCWICGQLRNVFTWSENGPICAQCNTAWEASEGTVPGAMEVLAWIVSHNQDVNCRREQHNSDRPFFPHPDWIFGDYPYPDHRDCLRAEESARSVLRALTTRSADPAIQRT